MMTRNNLIDWMGYWDRASFGPCIDKIVTFDDLVTCRRFNPSMTRGVMFDVPDAAMRDALAEYRKAV
jgi:hypothetical protein